MNFMVLFTVVGIYKSQLKKKYSLGKTPPSKNELSKLQARVKSDLALMKSENNNPDFKHVMAYNQELYHI